MNKAFRILLVLLACSPLGCGRNHPEGSGTSRSGAEIELRGTEIKLYHRGRLVWGAQAEVLRAEELNRRWRAEGIRASINQSEEP